MVERIYEKRQILGFFRGEIAFRSLDKLWKLVTHNDRSTYLSSYLVCFHGKRLHIVPKIWIIISALDTYL